MTFTTFKSAWNKLMQSSRRRLYLAGGAIVCAAAVFTLARAADAPAGRTIQSEGISVSEDSASYTVTLPAASTSSLKMTGQTLRIGSKDAATGVRIDQSVALPEADPTGQLQFSQEEGKVVVTVPKSAGVNSSSRTAQANRSLPMAASPFATFDQDVFAHFRKMQQQMDQLFGGLGATDPLAGLSGIGNMNPAGANIEDKGNNYVVHAKLPGESAKLNVAVDNDRVLKITAESEKSGGNRFASSHFTQVLTLPGPVQSSKMKVENENGSVIITLPKA